MPTMNRYSLWLPSNGAGSAMEIFRPIGVGDATDDYGGRSVVYVNGVDGSFVPYEIEEAAPGGQPDLQLTFFEQADINFFENMANKQNTFDLQRRFNECGSIDNPTAWQRIWHYAQGRVTGRTVPGGPDLRANGGLVEANVTTSFLAVVDMLKVSLSALTTSETMDLNAITGIQDKSSCIGVYPGADKVLFAAAAADTGVAANMLYSVDGGSTWTAMSNDPFGNDEHLGVVTARQYGDYVRVVTGISTAGTDLEIAYADVDLNSPGAATWTTVTVQASNTDGSSAIFWPEFARLYLASDGGDVFLSTDQGESWSLVYDGTNALYAFAQARNGDVYVGGASGTLLVEKANNQGTFSALTAPDANQIGAIASSYDGVLFVCSGTKLFRTGDNYPSAAAAYTEKKNFGTGYSPVSMSLEGQHKLENGVSELMRVVVDHATAGKIFESVDGGATFQQITALANTGYNDAYWSKYGNFGIVVGDDASITLLS